MRHLGQRQSSQLRTVGRVEFKAANSAVKDARPKQRTVARNVTVWQTLVLHKTNRDTAVKLLDQIFLAVTTAFEPTENETRLTTM